MNSTKLTTKQGEAIRKGRVSPALHSAIRLLVEQGLTIAEAAQRVDLKRESLAKALLKPHVRAVQADVKRAWMASQTHRSWQVIADLMTNAVSEKVRLECARTVLQAAGELSPIESENTQKAQVLIQFIRHDGSDDPKHIVQRAPGVFSISDDYAADASPAGARA